ncbi:hypothetical protein GCM10023213_47190 [Prosthecobacter algae]|uniref:Calx-beta domain-containing protein n=1 Tax=Prosthecobacter algae TaxID=1144682 RepID=A0ABP9PNA4_9BACT
MKAVFASFSLALVVLISASAVRADSWTTQAWTGDASTGIVNGETLWAYRFGDVGDATVNGVAVPVLTTPGASVANQLALSGFTDVIGFSDSNELTALGGTASARLATRFVYGGVPTETVTVRSQSLNTGHTYVMSFYTVGWDGDGVEERRVKFISGADELSVNQNMLGGNKGLRIDCTFTATTGDRPFVIQVDNAFNRTLHLYAVALKKVAIQTNLVLSSSANPVLPGDPVNFTASVTPVSGGSTATGSVVFKDGSTTLDTVALNGSGVATYGSSVLSEGSHNITATYGGSATLHGKVSPVLAQVVSKGNTSVTLASSLNPALPGASVTFTATVAALSGGGTPTGSVVFQDGSTTLSTVAINGSGVATYSSSALAEGAHYITASYGGSSRYNSSVSPVLTQSMTGTFTVTSTASSGAGSLAETFAAAVPGSFVVFHPSLAGQVLQMPASEIILNKNITLDASALTGGVILQGNGSSRLFYIPAGQGVTFKNLTFTGGGGVGTANTGRGGAVLNAGALTVMDCQFTGNSGVIGGALASGYSTQPSSLILQRCVISGNTVVGGHGGGVANVVINGSTATASMEDCTVTNNTATGNAGGVYNVASNGTANMTVKQCTLAHNSAQLHGGGVHNVATATGTASLMLTHCTLTRNTAAFQGGGLAQEQTAPGVSTTSLVSCIIAGNTAPTTRDVRRISGTMTSLGTNLIGTTTNSFVNWLGTDLTGNLDAILDARLAPLGHYGGVTQTCPPLLGSPALDAAPTPAFLTDQRGQPRLRDGDGNGSELADIGAVETVVFHVDVAEDELEVPAGVGDVSLREALRDAPSGAIITFAPGLAGVTLDPILGALSFTRSLVVDASSLTAGFGITLGSGSHRLLTVAPGVTASLFQVHFTGGAANVPLNGGGIFNEGALHLTRCSLTGLKSLGSGGAISTNSALTLHQCMLSENNAAGSGGAIQMTAGTLAITDSTMAGNLAGAHGGAIRMDAGMTTLSQSTLHGNTGPATGGGLSVFGGSVSLTHCTVAGNLSPEGSGGGLYLINGSSLSLHNTMVAGNGSLSPGADLDFQGATLTRTGANLIGNHAGASADFPAGLPNVNGDYVGTAAAPLDALLGPLADNGGPTQTRLPLVGSPVLDRATGIISALDQRGLSRPRDGNGDFVFVADIGAVEAGDAPTLVVNTLADELDTPPGASLSLREAIREAPAGTIITFAPALSGQTLVFDSVKAQMELNKAITLDASTLPAGLTLDAGSGANRHFEIDALTKTTIRNLTFVGGGGVGTTNSGYGGAIQCLAPLSLIDCTFHHNSAVAEGGAVDANVYLVQMTRCTFYDNTSSSDGGAISAFGSPMILDHCTLTRNHANGGNGGALSARNGTKLTLTHCTLSGNTSNNSNGGIAIFIQAGDSLTLNSTILAGNLGQDLRLSGSSPDLGQITPSSGGGNVLGLDGFFANYNQPTDIRNVTASQLNLAELGRYGGLTDTMPPLPNSPAIDRASASTATTDQRGFVCPADGNLDNNAVADSGAAESFVVSINAPGDQLDTPSGAQVTLREAVRDAPVGAVLTSTDFVGSRQFLSSGELMVDKSLILAGSSALRIQVGHPESRAIHVLPGVCFHLSRVDFQGAPALNSDGIAIGFSAGLGAVENGKGGAILNQGTLSLADCTLSLNGASQGGAIANGMAATPSRLTLKRCTLSGNQASTQGGAIYNSTAGGGAATVELENCLIFSNASLRHGGALANSSGNGPATLAALHCTVMNNTAASSGGGLYNNQGMGAAITTLTSTIVAGNTAPTGPDVQRASGTFTSNGTNLIGIGDAGGVTWAGSDLTGTAASPLSPQVNLATNTFFPLPGSPVLDAAGATTVILDRNRQPRVVDGNFTGGAQPDMGAVEAPAVLVTTAADELDTPAGANVSLREALRDAASGSIIRIGDALNGQTLTLNPSLGQMGNNGNSLYLDAGHLAAGFTLDAAGASRIFQFANGAAEVRLRGLTLKGGKVTGNGGAILNGARLSLENCWFTGNSVTGNGGAVSMGTAGGNVVMQGCTFTDNTATFRGGAVCYESGFLQQQVIQCTFSGNRAGSRGGGLYDAGVQIKISQSTFTGNEAASLRGGGVVVENCRDGATVDNCIIAGNRAPASPDLVVENSTFTRTGANVIGVEPATGTPVPAGLPNTNGDYVGSAASPLNALVASVGLYGGRTPTCPPMPGSPALDRAVGMTSITDQRGLTRSVDGDFNGSALPDIGAAESVIVRVDVAEDELDVPAGANDVSLREALRDAPEGAIIGFDPNLSGLTLGASGVLVPLRSVIISASGLAAPVTLTPQVGRPIFYLPSQRSLGLSHLNLTGANVSGANGAAIASDGSLSLSDCRLTSNITNFDGGAVAVNDGSLAINRCVFSGNQADNGGAIVLLSFGPSMNPRLTVEDSVFLTNLCPGRGGAISHYAQGGGSCQSTVRRSLFTGNQANAGGAVHHWANGGRSEVTLESCTFQANQVSGGGGAVFALCGSQGTATTTLNQCTIHQNSMASDGAVVSLADAAGSSSQMRLNRCTLAGNTTTASGGAVTALGFSGAASSITLDGCIIAGNSPAGTSPEVTVIGSGTLTSLGNNLIGQADGGGVTWQDTDLTGTTAEPLDPMLAPLGDYGGATQTLPPLPGSPARDPENGATTAPLFPLNVDQRGQPRLQGARVDIGAVEAGAADAPGTLAFAGPVVRVSEDAGLASIPVYRTGGSIGTLTVDYLTTLLGTDPGLASSADFIPVSDTLTFAPGQAVANIQIPIFPDPSLKEPHENFLLTLSNVTGGGALGAQSSTTVRILDTVDASVPSLVLTTPKANAIFTAAQGPQIAVTGSAKDDKGIQAVQVQINGGAFVDAALLPTVPGINPTFSLGVTAIPGVNQLVVRSVDERGKVSALTKRSFTYRVTSVLTVNIPATFDAETNTNLVRGAVALPASVDKAVANTYYVGLPIKLTAKALPGYAFSHWSVNKAGTGWSEFNSHLPSYTFIMQPGLTVTAQFTKNFFTPEITGTYSGLILPSTVSPAPAGTLPGNANTGLFTLTLSSTGAMSGTLKVDGASLPFKALMTHGGAVRFGTGAASSDTLKILRKGKADLELTFGLASRNPARMTGVLTQKQGAATLAVSNFVADRAHYSAKSKVPTALVSGASQRFNLTFPAVPQGALTAADYPPGTGIGSMILSSSGSVKFAGTLADNTPFIASAALSAYHQAPLFVSLYANKGHLAGPVTLVPVSNPGYDTFGVNYLWNRPAQLPNKMQWYPDGWPGGINLDMVGARYSVPAASENTSVIPELGPIDLTNSIGNATLTFMDGLLAAPLMFPVNISPKNVVTPLPLKTKNFSMKLVPATGEISGSFLHTDGKLPAYKATTLQKAGDYQGTFGYFLSAPTKPINGMGQGGAVMLLPVAGP